MCACVAGGKEDGSKSADCLQGEGFAPVLRCLRKQTDTFPQSYMSATYNEETKFPSLYGGVEVCKSADCLQAQNFNYNIRTLAIFFCKCPLHMIYYSKKEDSDMSDLYTEIIVKRKKTPKDTILKALLIAATVLAVLAALFTTLGLIAFIVAVALGIADFFLIPTFDVEFEYLYVNGELDIDKIMSKQKRKRVYSADIKNLELLAPTNSHALDSYNRRQDLKTLDFSSRDEQNKSYTMIIKGEKGLERVIFEPNEIILKDMKRVAPREVNLY